MKTEPARIVNEGMGGFLNPPTHPAHSLHVETDLRRRKENRGGMSIETAIECEYIDPATKEQARKILAYWQTIKPAIDSPEVKEWILQVLGYFRNCYKGEGNEETAWNASNLRIATPENPTPNEQHAGVHLIRKYYPEYEIKGEDFKGAHWGTKPTPATN